MTYFFNIYINVDIFTIVFYLPYYCNIRYVVLSLDEIKTHYYYYYRHTNTMTYIKVESMFLPTLDGICKFEALNKKKKLKKKTEQLPCNELMGLAIRFKQTDRHGKLECHVSTSGARCDGRWFPLTFFHFSK